ncbi:MAG: hypothetical protein N2Z65_02995 [Clostridiales bacterium]|nr:hypothetical protein [Clostridiales bacterium]
MIERYRTVNLEDGMPTVDQAIKRLTFEISRAKANRVIAMKLIHGFGSSGTGGRIRVEVRKHLGSLQKKGTVRSFVPGENFSIFDSNTRSALDLCNELRQDRDLDRHNNGITILIL